MLGHFLVKTSFGNLGGLRCKESVDSDSLYIFACTHCILRPAHGLPLAPIQKHPVGEPTVDAGPPIPRQRKPHKQTNKTKQNTHTHMEIPSGLDFLEDHTDLA